MTDMTGSSVYKNRQRSSAQTDSQAFKKDGKFNWCPSRTCGDYYGVLVEGYLRPTVTAEYYFDVYVTTPQPRSESVRMPVSWAGGARPIPPMFCADISARARMMPT